MTEETVNLRLRRDSNGDDITDESEPLHPALWPPALSPPWTRHARSELAFAPTELLPHPRLVRRELVRPGRPPRFPRASSTIAPLAPSGAPMFLSPRPRLPPPLRHRAAPPPLPVAPRAVTQVEDEFVDEHATWWDPDTQPFG